MVKKQQRQFMLFLFITFTIIYGIFGFLIFIRIQSSLLALPDQELLAYQDRLEFRDMPLPPENDENRPPILAEPGSPRIVMIKWNDRGTIINEAQIGTSFYQDFLADYQLSTDSIDEIKSIVLENDRRFRSLLIATDTEEMTYIELLINVDQEYALLATFEQLLVITSIIFIILSLTASYWLARKMIKPIMSSWEKQTEFVENASHELRTPLTVIQNKLELLLTTPQKKIVDVFENIAVSLSETNRLTKLTNDLLTLARADANVTQLEKNRFNLDAFIETIYQPYADIARTQDKQLELQLNSQQVITADQARLHQLMVILIDNALKYTEEGDTITLTTETMTESVYIHVKDTGIGIKEENRAQLFDRFYREDTARIRESGGVGLGLSIAHWIVTSHGGKIKALANQPTGTIFSIKLPIQ